AGVVGQSGEEEEEEEAAAAAAAAASAQRRQRTRDLIRGVGRVAGEGGLGGWAWDGVGLAIGVGPGADDTSVEEWDQVCADVGLEFVQVTGRQQLAARNEFGGNPP